MSSLVDYGSSDESENESANDDSKSVIESELPVLKESENTGDNRPASEDEDPNLGLFSSLPLPKPSFTLDTDDNGQASLNEDQNLSLFSSLPPPKPSFTLETDDSLIFTRYKLPKGKEPVKITIPSLSEFKDEESEPAKKKLKPSRKVPSLFSLLPAPKHLSIKETKRQLVPHVLTKKTPSIMSASSTLKSEIDDSVKNTSPSLISYADSEEESDGEGDFFSLKMDHKVEAIDQANTTKTGTFVVADSGSDTTDIAANEGNALKSNDAPLVFNSEFNPSPWPSSSSSSEHRGYEHWQNEFEPTTQTTPGSSDDYISVQQDNLQLNDEALQRLCGRRAKRQQQDMQLIEVNGATIMPDPKEWFTKQMTQEQETKIHSHSHRKNDGPTTQQRRKHQITYLAFQAKENELELKNQWSQNRMSRKQTQSKYGF
ncbi:hypothetical protein B7P43_G03242 [Cryptotermes secundus]|uniref:Proline-rich protein PRCC n=2 Tax=Cryptotermes secundus TaxID=105785 RepID=A0A2J7Q699_9NEOP|nr:proline-rich protein PRCC isoform X2 [Cryptotermes secundus]PNF24107.1 hypothetical protein B7P43_G03242 [Cryptotermes secundus]PNF24109.1 hypothetical protein B7P43_G03242 [Cryptotermes secundus]